MSVNRVSLGNVAPNYNKNINSSDNSVFLNILNNSVNQSDGDLDSIFEAASKKYNIPVSLLKSVAKTESNFNSDATSSCGAMGIMQLMPATAQSLGVSDAYDPQQNIMGGAKYLSQMLDEFDGDQHLAVAAYNAGPNSVRKYGGIPPFEETQNYVNKVLGLGDDGTNELASTADNIYSDTQNLSAVKDYLADSIAKMALMKINMVNMSNVSNDENSSFL